MRARGRQVLLEIVHNVLFENPRLGARREPRSLQRPAVHPGGVGVERFEVRGAVRDQPVEQLDRRHAARKGGVEPSPRQQPRRGIRGVELTYPALDLLLRFSTEKVEVGEPARAHEEVDVGVIETGEDGAAAGLDHADTRKE